MLLPLRPRGIQASCAVARVPPVTHEAASLSFNGIHGSGVHGMGAVNRGHAQREQSECSCRVNVPFI